MRKTTLHTDFAPFSARNGAMSENTHIEEAYCRELDDTVNILEASDYYFSLPVVKRKRLHFECPDEECRQKFHPEIIAVNYDKEIYERTPYFRRNPNHIHTDTCVLGKFENVYKKMLMDKRKYAKMSDRNLFIEGIKNSESLIDVYISKSEDSDDGIFGTRKTKNSVFKHHSSHQDIENKIRSTYLKTRRLDRVVLAFESLSYEQRKLPMITLRGHRMKYSTAFKNVIYIEEGQTWPHIYYGSAKIYKYREGYRAFFNYSTKHYSDSLPNLGITAFFPDEVFQNHSVSKCLKKAAQEKISCCVYMLASRHLENAIYGSDITPKERITLSAEPSETVITFNVRECR